MSSKTKLCVRNVDTEIPTVSPSLMPFHIAYSGRAPISTYFITKPFIDVDEKRRILNPGTAGDRDDNAKEDNHNESATSPGNDESGHVKNAMGEHNDALTGPGEGAPSGIGKSAVGTAGGEGPETATRLASAFRGRTVVSHDMLLPEGYTGLVLTTHGPATTSTAKGPAAGDRGDGGTRKPKAKFAVIKAADRAKALKAKAAAKLEAGGRSTKRSRRILEEDAEEEGEPDDGEEFEPEEQPVQLGGDDDVSGEAVNSEPLVEEKIFDVAGRFQSFTLWHPDTAMDEARDEYTRSVNEWIALAGEIHRI